MSKFQGKIPPAWIFLDIQLALNMFKNPELLVGIKTVANQENVYTYAGMRLTKQVGHQPLLKLDMWFNPHGIMNIISLAVVTNHYHVAFDATNNFFTVHL